MGVKNGHHALRLHPGMKVVARHATRLGTGEVFAVGSDPVEHYKVLFPSPPVKVFYEHELRRVLLPTGMLVQTRYGPGRVARVVSSSEEDLYAYEIEFEPGKPTKTLREDAIQRVHRGITGARDPVPGRAVPGVEIGSFLNAYYFRYCLPTDPRFQAICHGRIDAFPHQMSVIERVLSTYPIRFLLCDEVGLGKTIEALAVVKELLLQTIIHRVIIVVPANLVNQWQFELESKFNLDFTLYDGAKVKALREAYPTTNPWSIHPRIITSLHFARRDENLADVKDIVFDLVIFDEAHHLRRYQGTGATHRKTKSFTLGETLCKQARFVLLLTATPMQLNPFELYSLVSLIDEVLYPKYADFIAFKDTIAHFNLVFKNLDRYRRLNVFERKYTLGMLLDLLRGDRRFPDDDAIVAALHARKEGFKEVVFEKMRARHTLSKVMIRNKKKHVLKGFLPRRLTKIVLIEPTSEELAVYSAIRLYITRVYQRAMEEKNPATGFVMVTMQRLLASSHHALLKTIEQRIGSLRELQTRLLKQRAVLGRDAASMLEKEFREKMEPLEKKLSHVDEDVPLLGEYYEKLRALPRDSKAAALVDVVSGLLRHEPHVKIIVFTQFIRTLAYLRRVIQRGMPVVETGVFHGQLDKVQKDAEVERFKTASGKPYVFFSTEAGGEGRNFQFCHVVVNYDLPWNPMKLEQRIGRVDRLGQDHDVQVFNFAMKGTIEEHIVDILSKRILIFQELVGELEPILIGLEEDLQHAILSGSSDIDTELQFKVLDHKLVDTLKEVQDYRVSMQDLIMEMDSREFLDDESLACSLELNYYPALQKFAVHHASRSSTRGDSTFTLTALEPGVFSLRSGSITSAGTFDRAIAVQRERLDFFNLGHPFIETIVERALVTDVSGSCGVVVFTVSELAHIFGKGVSWHLGSTYLVACNVIEMSGVLARRQLLIEAYEVVASGCTHAGTLETGPFLEAILNTGISDHGSVDLGRLPWAPFHGENACVVASTIEGMIPGWMVENERLHARMKASEERYHSFKLKRLRDEINQHSFSRAEKLSDEDTESKSVKTLDGKIAKAEGDMLKERDSHANRMKEIEKSFTRAGIHGTVVALACFVVR